MSKDPNAYKKLTVAVAGGAGYLGTTLVPHLLKRGHRVRVLDRFFFGRHNLDETRAFGDACKLVQIDTRDITPEHLRGCDAVIDLAGLSNDPSCALDGDLTHSINVDGATRVLQAAKAAGVRRYIYQSSCSVYGSGGSDWRDEDSELAPVSAYAESKLQMERRVREEASDSFEVVLPRLGTVFGVSPRMRFDLIINLMTREATKRGRIFVLGGGHQWRPLIHVSDVARAHHTFLEAEADDLAPVVFNVGATDHNYQVSTVARLVARVVPHAEVIQVPDDVDKRSYRVDFSRFQQAFHMPLTKLPRDGAEELYEALQDERVEDGLKSMTVDFYTYLQDAKKLLDEVLLDGRLLA